MKCNHELVYKTNANEMLVCDGCQSRGSSEMWGCRKCDFALCKDCQTGKENMQIKRNVVAEEDPHVDEDQAPERPNEEQPAEEEQEEHDLSGCTGILDKIVLYAGADQTRTRGMLSHQAKLGAITLIFILLCGSITIPCLALTTQSVGILVSVFAFVCCYIIVFACGAAKFGSEDKHGLVSVAAYMLIGLITMILFAINATALRSFLAQERQGDMQIALVPDIKSVINSDGAAIVLTEAVRAVPKWTHGVYYFSYLTGAFSCFVPIISATQEFNVSTDTVQVFAMCNVQGDLCTSSSFWNSECAQKWRSNASRIIVTDVDDAISASTKTLIDNLQNNPPPFRWSPDMIVVTWEPVLSDQEKEAQRSKLTHDFTVAACLLPIFYVCFVLLLMVLRLRGANDAQTGLYALLQIVVILPFVILALAIAIPLILVVLILIFLGTMMKPAVSWKMSEDSEDKNKSGLGEMAMWMLAMGLVTLAWKTKDPTYITIYGLATTLPTFIGPLFMVINALQANDDLQKVALPSAIPDNQESLQIVELERPKCRCTCVNILTILAILVEFLQCCGFAVYSLRPTSSTAESGGIFSEILLTVVNLGFYFADYYFVLYWVVFASIIFHLLMWFTATKFDFQCKFLFQNVEPLFSGLLFFPFARIMLSTLKCSARDQVLVVDAFSGMYCYLGVHFGYLLCTQIVLGSYIAFVTANPSGSYKSSVSAKMDLRFRTIYVIAVNFIKVFMLVSQIFSDSTTSQLITSLVGVLLLGLLTLTMAPSPFVALNFIKTLLYFLAAWAIIMAMFLESRDLNQIILILGIGWGVELALGLLLLCVARSWFTINSDYVTTESQIEGAHLGQQLLG